MTRPAPDADHCRSNLELKQGAGLSRGGQPLMLMDFEAPYGLAHEIRDFAALQGKETLPKLVFKKFTKCRTR